MNPPDYTTTANHRILVIDDNPSIHEDFRKILAPADTGLSADLDADESVLFGDAPATTRKTHFEIDSATQGQEGLQKVQTALAQGRPYAMAFVDVRMPPGWDGIETIGHIWKSDPNLQIVVCTAYSDFSWDQIIEKLGSTDKLLILKKPFDNVEVLQFAHALTDKWTLARRANLRMEELDQLAKHRTNALQTAYDRISIEIQDRIAVEAALRASERRFSQAFNTNPVAMAMVSLATQTFVDVNATFVRMLGWSREQLVTYRLPSFPMWANPTDFSALLKKLQATPSVSGFNCTIKTRSGAAREARLNAEPFDLDGTPHLLLLVEDVTEHAKLESRLRQAQKMEAIGQLAAGVAHDFNNILTVIRGHVGLQLASSQLQGSNRASLAQVLAASERASSLTQQLLSFSRRQLAQPRPVELDGVIEQVSEMLPQLLGERVALEVECPAELPSISGDAGNIEVLLMNLAANARDAMPDGGTIRLSALPVNFAANDCGACPERRPGSFVQLSISDTGCGMSPEVLARVFEPFFTTKEVGKGTGLGLATVYGIVRQHDGWTEVRSQVGVGTTFDVYFPCSECAVEEFTAPALPVAQATGGTETILAAEDEPALRDLIQVVLEGAGYRVLLAENGPAALELFDQHSGEIDLLITDMMMPGGLNGHELAAELQVRKPGLRQIFTSGFSEDLMAEGELQSGELEFLQKPYDPDTLLRVVRGCLSANSACAATPA